MTGRVDAYGPNSCVCSSLSIAMVTVHARAAVSAGALGNGTSRTGSSSVGSREEVAKTGIDNSREGIDIKVWFPICRSNDKHQMK